MTDLTFMNKPTDFYKYVEDVIKWNKVGCLGKEDFSSAKISAQKKFVREEMDELHKAIQEKDKEEVVDALADIVVTAGYWLYLQDKQNINNSCKLMHYGMGADHVKMMEYGYNKDEPWQILQSTLTINNKFIPPIGL